MGKENKLLELGSYFPNCIEYNDDISRLEKRIMAMIYTMTKNGKTCCLGAKHFAQFTCCSIGAAYNAISRLKKLGFISVKKNIKGIKSLSISDDFFKKYDFINDRFSNRGD